MKIFLVVQDIQYEGMWICENSRGFYVREAAEAYLKEREAAEKYRSDWAIQEIELVDDDR